MVVINKFFVIFIKGIFEHPSIHTFKNTVRNFQIISRNKETIPFHSMSAGQTEPLSANAHQSVACNVNWGNVFLLRPMKRENKYYLTRSKSVPDFFQRFKRDFSRENLNPIRGLGKQLDLGSDKTNNDKTSIEYLPKPCSVCINRYIFIG